MFYISSQYDYVHTAGAAIPRVSFVLDDHTKNELSARAGGAGMSAYVRACLQEVWGREDRNNALLASLDELTAQLDRDHTTGSAEDKESMNGALMELLLLLRAIAGPDRMRSAQAEVERIGLPVWGSTMFTRS